MNKRQTYYKGYGFKKGLQYDSDEKHFYKENTTISPEKDSQYSNKDEEKEDFVRIIQKEVSKKVDKPFENIVVLAGAGASIADDMGKTVFQLYGEVKGILENDGNSYSFENLKEKKLIGSDNNLENILSSLIKATTVFNDMNIDNNILNIDKLNKTVDTIKRAIYKDTSNYKFDSTYYKHNILIKKLTNKLPNSSRLNVVTTNYDRLFEEAANELKFWVFDGFSFSNPPIFDSDIFDWQLVKNIPNSKTQELEYQSNIINLLKIHGSVDWIRDNDILIKKEISNNKDSNNSSDDNLYKKSVMIFPSSEKYAESYQEPYFSLMAKFQELLRKSNTLFITIGFSFADDHIFEMVSQCIKHNNSLSVLITDCDLDKDENKNWHEFEELSENYDIHFLRAALNTKDNQLPENMRGVLDTDLTNYL